MIKISDEQNIQEKKRVRGSKDGKYDLITYILEQMNQKEPNLSQQDKMDRIINLTPEDALGLFEPNKEVLEPYIKSYLQRNIKQIKGQEGEKKRFFPGRGGKLASERSILHELHFHLQKQDPPRTLAEFGLKIRRDNKSIEKESDNHQNVIDWAKSMLE